jgi:hypothetical protein
MGAVAVGDAIYVAGGGPQMGGGVKSAINEAFSLGRVDGFDEDEAQSKSDEGAVVLVRLLTT